MLFVIGNFMFTIKMMAVEKAANWWYTCWCGGVPSQVSGRFKADLPKAPEALYDYQYMFFIELFCETVPQLFLQITNEELQPQGKSWSTVAIFSVSVQAIHIVSILYKFRKYIYAKLMSRPANIENVVFFEPPEGDVVGFFAEKVDEKFKITEKIDGIAKKVDGAVRSVFKVKFPITPGDSGT